MGAELLDRSVKPPRLSLLGSRVLEQARDVLQRGLRHRRGHDLRRTFITLAQVDGARRDILERVTHNPTSGAAIDFYTSYPWTSLCEEVAKLKISRAPRRQVVKMPEITAGEPEPSTELTPELLPRKISP